MSGDLKRCPRCTLSFPITSFLSPRSGRQRSQCVDCQKEINKENNAKESAKRALNKAARVADLVLNGKVCCGCKQQKPLSQFKHATGRIDGRRSRCRDCERPFLRAYARNKTTEQKEKEKALRNAWAQANKTRLDLKRRQARSRQIEDLTDAYVKRLLTERAEAIKPSQVPAELIEMKREQLILKRLSRQIKTAIAETRKDEK